MNIRAQVRMNADDIADAQLAMPAVRRTWLTLAWAGMVLVFWLASLAHVSVALIGPVAVAAGVGVYFLRRPLQRRTAAQNLAGKADEELQLEYEFTDSGYRAATTRRSGSGSWDSLQGWFESPKTVALKPSQLLIEVIPKSALAPAELEQLLAFLRERVPQRQVNSGVMTRYWKLFLWAVLILLFFSFYSIFSRQASSPRRTPPITRP